MVNHNIQQIRPDLFSSLSGNVGPVYSFRVGPDDASRMSELIFPTKKEEVRGALHRVGRLLLRGWKRLHGDDVAGKPILFEPFPRVSDPLCDTKEVVDYMRKEMEERFGGAYEDTSSRLQEPCRGVPGQVRLEGPVHACRLDDADRWIPQAPLRRLPARVLSPAERVLRQAFVAHLRRESGPQWPC